MMQAARKVCVVTGSRAEYGLLYWIMRDLKNAPGIDLQIIATGMHLAPEFGSTVKEIERDGFSVSRKVEMLISSDTSAGVAKSLGLGVIGMSDALEQLAPDIVVVLGDRFEILAAVQACLMHKIPVAHIAGGDTTEGAFDEAIRHAITKMSHVHFVTNELSGKRVRQLGEQPDRIFVVGSPGLDHLRRGALLDRKALENALGADLGERNLLVTFHPVTLEPDNGVEHCKQLLCALDEVDEDIRIWFTLPNADTGGRELARIIGEWVSARPNRARSYVSLGQTRYLSLMSQVNAVVGNSSSGLYEAPSFRVATVDIGARQKGRLAARSVLHCEPEKKAIGLAIERAISLDCTTVENPYGDGHAADKIVRTLQRLSLGSELLIKPFHLVEFHDA